MTDYEEHKPRNIDEVNDRFIAFRRAAERGETPFGARRAAELDIQFSIDPSYGLTKERYAWFSNGNMFDKTNFHENGGTIDLTTSATGTDTTRIRSAYPGQYVSHSVAQPGMGLTIPTEYLDYDTTGPGRTVSLTHGEISAHITRCCRKLVI